MSIDLGLQLPHLPATNVPFLGHSSHLGGMAVPLPQPFPYAIMSKHHLQLHNNTI
jgi:hypothetical protein